jgi:hypothetical protein
MMAIARDLGKLLKEDTFGEKSIILSISMPMVRAVIIHCFKQKL